MLIVLERFYLVFWPDEGEDGKVSVHANIDLKGPQGKAREVGSACLVSFGKKLFLGQIAAVGKLVLSMFFIIRIAFMASRITILTLLYS